MASEQLSKEELQKQMNTNTYKTYKNLDQSMHNLHHQGDDKSRSEAEDIAKILISYADLPLYFRCRALLILGCSGEPGYVEWAKEAVRVAEMGMADIPAGEASAVDTKLVNDCKDVLKWAEADFAERGGYDEDESEEEVEGADDGEEGESVLIWETPDGLEESEGTSSKPKIADRPPPPPYNPNPSRRIDSATDREEVWDEELQRWVPVPEEERKLKRDA